MGASKDKGPLRGWTVNPYDEKGRAASGLDEKGHERQIPTLPKAGDTYNASRSGDVSK